jgi:hypothetical protein
MATASTIAILDDEPKRIRAMIECVSKGLPGCHVVTFDNAPDMIGWLEKHLEDASLICLDHDLGPNRSRNGQTFDPGTGRDVTDYLALRRPVCPVLIHTTNSLAAPGMAIVLDDSGWVHSRLAPYNDLEWLSADWICKVRRALAH